MRVLDTFVVKGRKGKVAYIDALPAGLTVGTHVQQDSKVFRVTAIECFANRPIEQQVGKSVGLLLVGVVEKDEIDRGEMSILE